MTGTHTQFKIEYRSQNPYPFVSIACVKLNRKKFYAIQAMVTYSFAIRHAADAEMCQLQLKSKAADNLRVLLLLLLVHRKYVFWMDTYSYTDASLANAAHNWTT